MGDLAGQTTRDEPAVVCDVPGCDGLTVTDGMVERGAAVLRELLGDLLGTDQELEQMAWAVLTDALRVRLTDALRVRHG